MLIAMGSERPARDEARSGDGGRREEARERLDIREKGGVRGGEQQTLDRRLFMQLLSWTGCRRTGPLVEALELAGLDAVLYEDVNDPRGVALLTYSEDPGYFLDTVRPVLVAAPFHSLQPRPEYTMLGRTYSLGYEPELEEALLERPRARVTNPEWPWAVWYPLRRSGEFEKLPEEDQRRILKEHGTIGIAFGAADYAHDVRLACHGLDKHDNDFVIGLIGAELYPLSYIVQTMRGTEQTSQYLTSLGPFFIGRALWQGRG